MTSNHNNKRSQPIVEYQLVESDSDHMENAFDILFEETFKKYDDLTASDN